MNAALSSEEGRAAVDDIVRSRPARHSRRVDAD